MVWTEKKEQRGQAVKRLRSLFDMHHIAFGRPENLGGVAVSVQENRHFAMDFWAMVGALTSSDGGAFSDEEMLETVVESATGTEARGLAANLRPSVIQLREMLAGVDVARPVELPDAIAEPDDALLTRHKYSVDHNVAETRQQRPGVKRSPLAMNRVEHTPRPLPVDNARVAQRSIGEALARLEQTSRELREQLAAIAGHPEQLVETGSAREAGLSGLPQAEASAVAKRDVDKVSVEPAREEPYRVGPTVVAADVHFERHAEPIVPPAPLQEPVESMLPAESAHFVQDETAPVASVMPFSQAVRIHETTTQPVPQIPHVQIQPETMPEREVFAPRPVHTLSQRGLATPEPHTNPSSVPLSGYAAEERRSPVAHIAVAAVVIAVLAAGPFFVARTDAGQTLWTSAGTSLNDAYLNVAARLNVLKREATTPTPQSTTDADDANGSSATPAHASDAATSAPASTPTPASRALDSNSTANPTTERRESVTPKPRPPVIPQEPRKRPAEGETATTRPESFDSPAANDSVLRVPASTMAENLITSRVPAYPEAAKAQEIEGPVVMEVVVATTGAVKQVHVINGDRHLRAAAEESVLKRRYRPYLLNGTPVEVATIVRVDFRLPQ